MVPKDLINRLSGLPIPVQLRELAAIFPGKVIFTTSFGLEDQVITHMIFKENIPIRLATIDTGRLFPETYHVFDDTLKIYGKQIEVYFPDNKAIETLETGKGPFSFYGSVTDRLECCGLRKTEPLGRILQGNDCWISGIRADQSENRRQMDRIGFDETRKMLKFFPLFDWSIDEVKDFIKKNSVPYNRLHDRGFVSIGCQPCTRPAEPGSDPRSGRWWWENGGKKECGLHLK